MSTEQLVTIAQRQLIESPFDAVHDERHHEAVWNNCLRIIEEEKLENLNLDALKIAAWWHDVQRGQDDENALLKVKMHQCNISREMQNTILEIVGSHSFGNLQGSTEAQILFDADKLEYVSDKRGKILINLLANGKISKEGFDHYVKIWRERIASVRGQVHFESAKKEFEKRLETFSQMAKNDEELRVFVDGLML